MSVNNLTNSLSICQVNCWNFFTEKHLFVMDSTVPFEDSVCL